MQYIQISKSNLKKSGFSSFKTGSVHFPKDDAFTHVLLEVAPSYLDDHGVKYHADETHFYVKNISLKKKDRLWASLIQNPKTGQFSFPINFDRYEVPQSWIETLNSIGVIIEKPTHILAFPLEQIEKSDQDSGNPLQDLKELDSTSNTSSGSGMMSFDDFLSVINHAVHKAAGTVRHQNLSLLKEYFQPTNNPLQLENSQADLPKTLTPKTALFEFPVQTEQGSKRHVVQAPLISLIPTSQFQIKEVKISADLEFGMEDNQLKLGVSSSSGNGQKAKVEVVIESTDPVQGFVEVTDGYDRALRAQIPG